ncbi:MAG: T9SS type A sorting domain-containing protein [Bacteroidota bacterium]
MRHTLQHLLSLTLALAFVIPSVAAAPTSDDVDETPDQVVLSAAFPNPFQQQTTFNVTAREAQHVKVEVFNFLGQSVEVLHDGLIDAGVTKRLTFKPENLPSGLYLYRASGDGFSFTRQFTLIK